METLEALVQAAREAGASDLHLEAGLPPTMRVRGDLKAAGPPASAAALLDMARALIDADWPDFLRQHSADLSRVLGGTRCRINILQTARGVGLAVRLLASVQPTLHSLNLNPVVRSILEHNHGLIVVTGPTGSGKTSTMAAFIHELNTRQALHIITVEHPIEYLYRPQQSFIRQREVGRDTPDVRQALMDALREDPDVLVVGEMRDAHTMRLTLDAAETGHLVIATMHSSTAAEALARMVNSFPPEQQPAVAAQLADCLVAVVAQRMTWRPAQKLRVPEIELVVASPAVRANIRAAQFFKLQTALESGGGEGQWTFARYRDWLDRKKDWAQPSESAVAPDPPPRQALARPPPPAARPQAHAEPARAPKPPAGQHPGQAGPAPSAERVLVLDDDHADLAALVQQLEKG